MLISILGPLLVQRAAEREVDVSGTRLRLLLVRLAAAAGRPVSTAELIEALWSQRPPADEANALQSLVSRLRRTLGDPQLVQQAATGYRLNLTPDAVDATRFERLAGTGREQLRSGDPGAAAGTLRTALELWRGEIADGVEAGDAARLRERRLEALADRIEADLQLGRHADLVAEIEALRAAHPLRERFAAQLMTALAGSGRQAEALAVYEQVRMTLAAELGVDPTPELRERHLAVLRGSVSTTPAPTHSNLPTTLTSFVGRDDELARAHELLDTGRLVTVLGPGGAGKTRLAIEVATRRLGMVRDGVWFVELAPVTDPAEVAHTVLAALGARETEVLDRRVGRVPRELLDRLLEVLTGRQCLLVLDNCEHVLDAVAHLANTLLTRCPGLSVLTTSREPLGIIGESLAPLSSLPTPPRGAGAEEAHRHAAVRLFADRAAAVCPGFAVDDDTVGCVVEIVRRLDGLPLAIELAAARLRTLPVTEIAARLSDRFRLLTGGSRTAMPRHRTLRAVVDWSWELLTAPERLLAERIAVFPAGVTPASAAGVCVDGGCVDGGCVDGGCVDGGWALEAQIPDLLGALVDKSLLVLAGNDGPRYRMLETIREYGTDRLAERGELAEARRRHAHFFADLATRADSRLRSREQLPWLRTLVAEHDNVLAALRTLVDAADKPAATALALDLAWYWMMTDRQSEASTWLGIVLAMPGEMPAGDRIAAEVVYGMSTMAAIEIDGRNGAEDPRARLAALGDGQLREGLRAHPVVALLAPILLFFGGEVERCRGLLDGAVAHGDDWTRASARTFRARLAENDGELGRARDDIEAALAAFEEIGDRWGAAQVLPLAAELRLGDGDLEGAATALEQARDALAALDLSGVGDNLMIGMVLATVRYRQCARGQAQQLMRTVARLAEGGGPENQAITLAMAASLERLDGELRAASELQCQADHQIEQAAERTLDAGHGIAIVQASGALLDLACGDEAAAAQRLAAGYRAARQTGDLPIAAHLARSVAAFARVRERPRQTARLLGLATRLRGRDDPTDSELAGLAAWARERLGDEEFTAVQDATRQVDVATALDGIDPAQLTG